MGALRALLDYLNSILVPCVTFKASLGAYFKFLDLLQFFKGTLGQGPRCPAAKISGASPPLVVSTSTYI